MKISHNLGLYRYEETNAAFEEINDWPNCPDPVVPFKAIRSNRKLTIRIQHHFYRSSVYFGGQHSRLLNWWDFNRRWWILIELEATEFLLMAKDTFLLKSSKCTLTLKIDKYIFMEKPIFCHEQKLPTAKLVPFRQHCILSANLHGQRTLNVYHLSA